MNVMIILGNRINDDGTMTQIMKKRLDLSLTLKNEIDIDYIIVSGGYANEKVEASEADIMYDYLVQKGIDSSIIIKENKSLTTKENALYSVPLALAFKPSTISVVTSLDHYMYSYNIVEIFSNLVDDETVNLLFFTNSNK